jgi:hypothetical protein
MRAEAKRPRRIWPWLRIGAAVLAALVFAIVVLGHGPTGPPSASPSKAQTSAPPVTGDADPTGCLGGVERNAKMVLAARTAAPHTSNGAIEVATAFVRWLNQYPYPSAGDIAEVQTTALSSRAQTKDIAAFFATNPNLSGGLVADDSPYYLSTVPGVYYLESAAPDEVTASIGTALVVGGDLSATLKGSITVTVSWESGGWKFVSSKGARTTQELYSIGLPFTSGC